MKHLPSVVVGLLSVVLVLCLAGAACAQFTVPPTYPDFRGDPNDYPVFVRLRNPYIQCTVGIQGKVLANAEFDDEDSGGGAWGRGDKVFDPDAEHNWRVSGRWGITTVAGDPEQADDNDKPLTFMGFWPCHYFGYWKLRIGNDMRMIGTDGSWYTPGNGQPMYSPTLYPTPPPDLVSKEKTLGVTGPFLRAIWRCTGGSGSEIRTEIRIHLVRDMARFEYRITNFGTATESVGLSQNGDVETGDPAMIGSNVGGYYGPYDNRNYAFMAGTGASQPIGEQRAMMFGGFDPEDGKTLNPPVPDWFEVYDDVTSPVSMARNVLALEDATKPDVVAIGEYNDLYHKDMWVPTDYRPDKLHNILDMCWVLCWAQKPLAPGATRTIITYYGVGAATSRWTYLSGRNPTRDQAVLAVQAPRSIRYDSTTMQPGAAELSPASFSVKAYVYNLATDPGPYDLRDAVASIYLPKGLQLVPQLAGNEATKSLDGIVELNSESAAVEWKVMATGDYAGELPIYVSVVDKDPSGRHWQQSVTRKVFVPATKRGQFQFGWQLMHVPFAFNNPTIDYVFGLTTGLFSAKYYDTETKTYRPLTQVTPGQSFWMYVDGPTWGHPRTYYLVTDAAIVGEALGTGRQTLEQHIQLARGWNMVGNPFVYPVYWGQVLVYSGGETRTLDDAYRSGWIDKTLFSWNTDKWDYDISSDTQTLLNPWKGYWVNTYRPVTLVIRPPAFPAGDVTAYPGGN